MDVTRHQGEAVCRYHVVPFYYNYNSSTGYDNRRLFRSSCAYIACRDGDRWQELQAGPTPRGVPCLILAMEGVALTKRKMTDRGYK